MTKSIEIIREKVVRGATDYSKSEQLALSEVYGDVTYLAGKRRVLDVSCSSCLISAVTIIGNYIKYHEHNETPIPEVKANVYMRSVNENDGLTLSQLRTKYPGVKATSVIGFISKL